MKNYHQELSDYFKISIDEVLQRSANINGKLKQKWEKSKNSEEFHKTDLIVYRMMRYRPKVWDCLSGILSFSITRGDKKILDYGCGVGSYLIPLAEVGFEMTGVEVQDSVVLDFVRWRLKKRYLDVPVFGHKELDLIKENTFDAILFYDVLEHLDNPFEVVKRLHHLLKSKGILYMTFSPHGGMTKTEEINDKCLPFLNKYFYKLDSERWLHK